MIKILFVCHGNICRSPMAELMLKKKVKELGISDKFEISSCATSTEELGNPVYPPAKAELLKHGITCEGKYAVQMKKDDYNRYDLIIAMDSYNIRNMYRIIGEDKYNKVHKLMEYAGSDEDVSDPWYCGNFDMTYEDIEKGLDGLLKTLDF